MKKFDLTEALERTDVMRNFKCARNAYGEHVYSAQFDTDTPGKVWALEVAFTRYAQWGWRTGARHLPRSQWELVMPDDLRCRNFAARVCVELREAAHKAIVAADDARAALAAALAAAPF